MKHITKNPFFLLLIAACLVGAVVLLPAGQAAGRMPTAPIQIEIDALVALYYATGGPQWTHHDGWLVDPDPCNWYGVTCGSHTYPSYHVIWLHLANNNLTGQLPPEIVNLTQLDELLLNDNHLTGPLPAGMDNFDYMINLLLNNNQLTGPIPADLGGISVSPGGRKLLRLYLHNNQLEGKIPPELGNITSLFYLNLSGNRLSGQVPASLGNLALLREVDLSSNGLHGELPASLGNLVELRQFYAANNYLGGAFPAWLANKPYLEDIRLNHNYFSGPIPDAISSSTKLQVLWLGNNYFNGNLPVSLVTLTDLISIWVSKNNMEGMLPEALTSLNLYSFWYDQTALCEPCTNAFETWLGTIHNLQRTRACTPVLHGSYRYGLGGSFFGFRGYCWPPSSVLKGAVNGEVMATIITDPQGKFNFEVFANVPADSHGVYILTVYQIANPDASATAWPRSCAGASAGEPISARDYFIVSPTAPYLPSSGSVPVYTATEDMGLDHWLYLPMVRRQVPLTIVLGSTTTENNLYLQEGGDFDTALITAGSPPVTARRTGSGQSLPSADNNQVGDYYLQFNVADGSMAAGNPTMKVEIEVEYLDQGTDQFNIQYDALSGGPFGDGRFKDTATITKTGSGQWRTAVFQIGDAYFANRDHGGDFRLYDFGDGYEIVRKVTVSLLDD